MESWGLWKVTGSPEGPPLGMNEPAHRLRGNRGSGFALSLLALSPYSLGMLPKCGAEAMLLNFPVFPTVN